MHRLHRKIKFGRFLELADEWGADFIATGHYAGSVLIPNPARIAYTRLKQEEKTRAIFSIP